MKLQEYIPVGSVPSAAVAPREVSQHAMGGGYVSKHALDRGCLLRGVSAQRVSAWGVSAEGDVCPSACLDTHTSL